MVSGEFFFLFWGERGGGGYGLGFGKGRGDEDGGENEDEDGGTEGWCCSASFFFFVPNCPLFFSFFFSNNNLQCIMQPSNSNLSLLNRRIQIPLTRAQQRTRIVQKRNSQNHYQFRFLGRLSRRHHRALSALLLGAR